MKAKTAIFATIILGGLGAAYYAVRTYYLVQINKLENEMQYAVTAFRFGKVSLDLLEVFLTIRLNNKSNISAEILDFTSDVMINNIYVATVRLDKERLISKVRTNKPVAGTKQNILPANGYSDIDIEIDIVPKQIKDNVLDLVKSYWSTKDLSIRLDNGYVQVKVGPFTKKIDFDYSTTVKELMAP